MIEEAFELESYLPVSYKTAAEKDYVAFLWDAFETNYTSQKYEFASLAFHLLYMTFVSFSIWQIRFAREQDFRNALIGFLREAENDLIGANTPFKFYEKLKEGQIFRFLKLIGCTNNHVGDFAQFVKRRNKIAHPSGTVFFNDQVSLDGEITKMMREVANIQEHMRPIILEVYGRFLIESADIDEREYADPDQQIEVRLIHRSYVSQKDIDVCLNYDISKHQTRPDFSSIETLHQSLKRKYPSA